MCDGSNLKHAELDEWIKKAERLERIEVLAIKLTNHMYSGLRTGGDVTIHNALDDFAKLRGEVMS